jgi:hypothetical protein
MDKKSKIILYVFFISLIISVTMTYKRTMVDKNFEIINNSTPIEQF